MPGLVNPERSRPTQILSRSFEILGGVSGPLAAVVLAYSLPLNLVAEYLVYEHFGVDDIGASMRIYSLVYAALGPFLACAAIVATRAREEGRTLSSGSVVREAAERWGQLIKVQIPASVMIVLGLIAFIVPGIILAGRWALIESVSIVEGRSSSECRSRSRELLAGHVPWVLGTLVLLFLPSLGVVFVGGVLMGLDPRLDQWAFSALMSAGADFFGMLTYIGMYLVYTERARAEPDATATPPTPAPLG